MTVDLGLEELLKKENEEFQNKNSKSSSTSNNASLSTSLDIETLQKLYEKKDFNNLKNEVEKSLAREIKDSPSYLVLKCYELILNFEEEKLPSFVMLAPFGEICENIKKTVKTSENSNVYNEVLRLGKIIYDKFFDNLTKLNEQDLLNVLTKYESIFPIVNEKVLLEETSNYSKRTKAFIEDVTMSTIHTKKKKQIIWMIFLLIVILGSVIIYKNETFGFRKTKSKDFISFENINYEFNFDKEESEKLKQKFKISKKEMQMYSKNQDGIALTMLSKKKKQEPIFSLGMYEIIKEAPVRIKPNKKAKIIGKFSKGDKIKVVGKEGKYYKIASKDNKHFGYVFTNYTKFLIGVK